MTLPVSSYEALLVQVRELTHETILLQRQLSSDLYNNVTSTDVNQNLTQFPKDYEEGKLLYDNVTQRCDRKIEVGQRNLVDRNELAFHPYVAPSFDCARENFSSGELKARLIAWRKQNRQPPTETDEDTSPRGRSSSTVNTEETARTKTTCIPRVGRVGVQSGDSDTPSLNPWEAAAPIPPSEATGTEREAQTVVRPYYAAGDPPVSRDGIIPTELLQSAFTSRVSPTSNNPVPRTTESLESFRERCQSTRSSYRNHRTSLPRKGHDTEMDTSDANLDNLPNSGTPSPELYTRTKKCYDEDGSSEEDSKHDDGSQAHRLSSLYHGTWPVKRDLWTSQQINLPGTQSGSIGSQQNDMASVMSFSSSTGVSSSSVGMHGHRRLGAKVDVVYSLLGMLGSTEGREDMSATLLAMSNSIDNCLVMRQSGCLPLLVQLIHAPGQDRETRERASRALHNVIHARSDEKIGRREARVLRLLEQVRDYCQALRASLETVRASEDLERHPGPTIAALMKLSFDEAHRHAMCQLGGLHAVSELIEIDHASHGSESEDQSCVTLRRYAGMALTNLTFGDGNNKALLCSFRAFMKALVSQLRSLSDDLRQVTASVLRNLSWRADSSSKQTLREVGAVTGLMRAAMEGRKESTLKSILSALWNLSAHCSTNKVDICAVEGALAFLVDMLSYKAPSKTLSIVENAGGILRNVSSHIAVREDYRKIVRERGCLQVLLRQLRSPSLTVVSNACGALWNLSARCSHDQRLLWDLGAVPMLRSLVHSKHKMISMGSSAALKNLLSARPAGSNLVHLDSTARGLGLPTLPTLVARRQRALEQEIDQNLAETCDNIEPSTSPTNKDDKFLFKLDPSVIDQTNGRNRSYQTPNQSSSTSKYGVGVPRSDSRESMRSVTSTHSDTIFERVNRHMSNALSPADALAKQQSSSLHSAVGFDTPNYSESGHNKAQQADKKYALRYKNCIPDRLRPNELGVNAIGDLRCTASTMSWATAPDQESAACSQILMHSSVEDCLSPTSSTKLSLGRNNLDFTRRADDSTLRNTRVIYKSPTVRSPSGNSGFGRDFLGDISPEKSIDEQSQTINPRHNSATGSQLETYAETDLDQPTDYSLRYAEKNSDEEDKDTSKYFAETEQQLEDSVKNYYTEGTPYETPLNTSALNSDNEITDLRERRTISINHTDNFSRDSRREGYLQRKSGILESSKDNFDTSAGNCTVIHGDTMTDNFHRRLRLGEESESLPGFDHFVTERSQASPCHLQSLESGFDADSGSSMDTVGTRLNSLIINDEPKIINDSISDHSQLHEIESPKNSLEVESFPDHMISDGDDDDEDLLAACIHIGMQNNKHRQSFRRNSLEKTPPAESNLARYQTSTALDQVEINGYADHSDRQLPSESSRFNIKPTALSSNDNTAAETTISGYVSFQDNFNVAKDDEKITVQYQKLHEYSCNPKVPNSDNTDGNVSPCEKFEESKMRDTRANSVEDNLAHDEMTNDSSSNHETRDSESVESFDSIERSEQALLELCIKTGAGKTEAIPIRSSNSISSASSPNDNPSPVPREDISVPCLTATDHQTPDASPLKKSTRQNRSKNVEDEYRRQRDPDAMIASLDRLTATLVQQTEAMRERESSAMKQSVISDTWNEDSPNDVSYPSISVSAPFIASFKSDLDEEQVILEEIHKFHDSEMSESSSMTNSRIIEREAIRMAEAVSAEAIRQRLDYGSSSLGSNDLETVAPPSTMDTLVSLTSSNNTGFFDNSEHLFHHRQSNSLSPIRVKGPNSLDAKNSRKKSLPIGVMAKRALAHDINHTGSLESLLNECSLGTNSHLENVMPPSLMDEIFDNGDMENSMISVASITSEIADSKDQDSNSLNASDPIFDLVQPVANVLSITCMRYAAAMHTSATDSMSEYLENINPPSLLNEISDMDDSTMEANTETMCSDTLCIDAELRTEEIPQIITVERIEEFDNDTDEAGTPIATESCYTSSAESTPKKRSHKSHLTPKQKRQLAKERFRTYTIAAELVKKEEDERRKHEQSITVVSKIGAEKIAPFPKLTPKQRRQEDPARFQTQVLANSLPEFVDRTRITNQGDELENSLEAQAPEDVEISSIPSLSNYSGSRTFTKKRADNKQTCPRDRTRATYSFEAEYSEAGCIQAQSNGDESGGGSEAILTMLEKNANIVLHSLNETSRVVDNNGEESMLDCETLSLVSIESESENSLRNRRSTSIGKKLMTNYAQRASQQVLTRNNEEARITIGSDDAQGGGEEALETREETPEISDSESDEDSANNGETQTYEAKRPKIVKPGTMSRDRSVDSQIDKSEPGSPKGIRGRRKALYSTPNTRKTTPQSSPLKQTLGNMTTGIPIGRSNTTPVVRATRATTLRQNTNVNASSAKETSKLTNVAKMAQQSSTPAERRTRNVALAKRSSIPQRGATCAPPIKTIKRHSTPPGCATNPHKETTKVDVPVFKPLERQGTFTKDEPEVENAPTVDVSGSPIKSKIAKPTRGSPIRANPAGKTKISVRTQSNGLSTKLAKCSSIEKIQSPRVSTSLPPAKKQAANDPPVSGRSQSEQTPVATTEIGRGAARRFTSQRSNSNSSIASTPSTPVPIRKLPKEATSKIASLWKKVEDSKNKQKFEKPDTRQWITAPIIDSTDSQEITTANKPPAFRLFRSSTFEGVSPQDSQNIVPSIKPQRPTKIFESQANFSKYRNSCDLTGISPAGTPCKIPVKFSDKRTSGNDTTVGYGTIVLRKQRSADSNATTDIDPTKRISRLGSFFRVDSTEAETSGQPRTYDNLTCTPASTIPSSFNYNSRAEVAISTSIARPDDDSDDYDYQTDIVTGSARVTTV